jgi:hypothetical protein
MNPELGQVLKTAINVTYNFKTRLLKARMFARLSEEKIIEHTF